MRSKEVLIQLLIEEIQSIQPIDGMPTYTKLRSGKMLCESLCPLLFAMENREIISYDELKLIRSSLNTEITSKEYPNFPITFFIGKNSPEVVSDFFNYYFEPNQWSIRIKWLKEVLENIKNDAK